MPLLFKTSSLGIFLLLIFTFQNIRAQDKSPAKFGKVSPEDFQVSNLKVDTSYGAVILADIGTSNFQGNQKGYFSLVFTHYRRIKILNKKAYELGDLNISLYQGTGGDEEKITNFKASTYSLENGKVIETKMPKDAKFTEREDLHHTIKKFSFPNVKDGCILEYSYSILSDYFGNFQPWSFQGTYPCLWSEYEADIPEFFIYDIQAQGYLPFDISTTKQFNIDFKVTFNGNDNFSHPETTTLNSNNTDHRWVIKNVPAIKEESFTSSIYNYLSKIEFQLSGIRFPNGPYHDYRSNWKSTAEKLLTDDLFGNDLKRENAWMNESLGSLKSGTNKPIEKAQAIYEYVKSNLKWNGTNSYFLSQSLRETFKNKSGNIADINLLLVAMLRHEKFEAYPVILSTRSHGFVSNIYPLLDRFNYAICLVKLDSSSFLLDASKPYLSFGKLPSICYNGDAKIIKEDPESINLSADNIKNVQITSLQLLNSGNKPGNWSGHYTSSFGEFTSNTARNNILDKGKSEYLKKIKESYRSEISIDSIEIENEKDPSEPIKLNYKVQIKNEDNPAILYINPMMSSGYQENPFKSQIRSYPVEMPYAMDEIYSFRMEIPKGYKVDEIPKSTKVKLNESEGNFEHLVVVDGDFVLLRSRIRLNKAAFLPSDYEALRNFFDLIVKKHAEQIVFKKI